MPTLHPFAFAALFFAVDPAEGVAQNPTPEVVAIRLAPPVRLMDAAGPIDVSAYTGHAGPLFADVLGRGKPDLLVGTFRGNLALWRNEAEAGQAPRFASAGLLEAEGEPIRIHNW